MQIEILHKNPCYSNMPIWPLGSIWQGWPMPKITLEDVEAARGLSPKRCCFAQHEVVTKREDGEYRISLKFASLGRLFEAETGIKLNYGRYGPYLYTSDAGEIETALKWQHDRSQYVFLQDRMASSVALAFNLASAGVYTNLGRAEHDAKADRNPAAIEALASACISAIRELVPFFGQCTGICAVPPSPEKPWDLPTELARIAGAKTGKADISPAVRFRKNKKSVKSLQLKDKWDALEAAGLDLGVDVRGKKIILLDDKYQSGTTAQYLASRLYAAGAAEVHGLYCVKTWRDTDNQ